MKKAIVALALLLFIGCENSNNAIDNEPAYKFIEGSFRIYGWTDSNFIWSIDIQEPTSANICFNKENSQQSDSCVTWSYELPENSPLKFTREHDSIKEIINVHKATSGFSGSYDVYLNNKPFKTITISGIRI